MIYLLIFGILFLSGTTAILIRNRFGFRGIGDPYPEPVESDFPLVSICIPARNEENVIERCVTSALKQDYPKFEVLVLDDNSDDRTGEILSELSGIISNLKLIEGQPKPQDWLGKPWACHQLSKAANGEILIFMDADVWLEPHVLKQTVNQLREKDAITIWPEQQLDSFWENIVVPVIYFALVTMLPAVYVERSPRWMPDFLKPLLDPKFIAGCGQFIAFQRSAYDTINGHESVKSEVVEDMELARTMKKSGHPFRMLHGINAVYCRMYTNHKDMWRGFQKNFLAGFGNIFEFIFMGVVHIIVFLLPYWTLVTGIIRQDSILIILSSVLILMIFTQRLILNLWFRWNPFYALLHPLSVVWYQILGLSCIANRVFGIKTKWKGREV